MLSDIRAGSARIRLLEELRMTIIRHTTASPMPADEVLGVVGLLAGLGIAAAPKRFADGQRTSAREYRQMVMANIDKGLELGQVGEGGSIIFPN